MIPGSVGDGVIAGFKFLFVANLIAWPLALWKLGEIMWWAAHHIHIGLN